MKSFKNEKNTYNSGSPEWQIFERIKSAQLLNLTHQADAERSQSLAAKALNDAEVFMTALKKLDPTFSEN